MSGARPLRRGAVADASVALRRSRVMRAIDALPEIERLVLALALCDGLTASEIGQVLDLAPRAVARHRERALTAIHRMLAGFVPAPAQAEPQRSAL